MTTQELTKLIDKLDIMGDKKQFKSILHSLVKGVTDENKAKELKHKIDSTVVFTSTPSLLKSVLYELITPTMDSKQFKESVSNLHVFSSTPGLLKQIVNGMIAEGKKEYKYVDLGLPSGLLWADRNVGANSESEYGDYFIWGSVISNTDSRCTWETNPLNGGSWSLDEEYFASIRETACPNNILALEYDAAHVNMGDDWRMPNKSEIEELIANTTKEKIVNYNNSGITCWVFTSNINGNKLVIPCSGSRDSSFTSQNQYLYIYSSELYVHPDYTRYAYVLTQYMNTDVQCQGFYRCNGCPVRGVKYKTE